MRAETLEEHAEKVHVEEVMIRVRSRRVFKVRIWLGMLIVSTGFWVMGATAEAAD